MSRIFIIAGPPGIGKSTSGVDFIPENLTILDPDQIAQRYREQGFKDYKDIGNLRFNDLVKKELFAGSDFGIEINLGFQSHYDFVKSVKNFNPQRNTVKVVLFHTDDIYLCFQRARIRHERGLHLVPSEVIRQMYDNTIPLIKSNFSMLSSLIAVDVTGDELEPEIKLKYERDSNALQISDKPPQWIESGLKDFLLSELQEKEKRSKSQSSTELKKSSRPRKGPGPRM